jgi:spore germination cell wall hydrolase CwlJ-like protein
MQAEMIKVLEDEIQFQDAKIKTLIYQNTKLQREIEELQTHNVKPVSRGEAVNRISGLDMQVIAGVVHAEAKGEPSFGKMLVAKVIMNRMAWNPELSAREIVTRTNQFAPWEQYDKASMDAVRAAMVDTQYNHLAGFHNPDTATSADYKSHKVLLIVGNHEFW